jgi:Ser/Thr protein kinase RdoA (MazF antagonist)
VKIVDVLARFLPGERSVVRGATSATRAPAGGFPQLKLATDPELMREVLPRHLLTLGERAYEVRECRIPYSLHREDIRCVVHYDLHLAEPDKGREWSQLVTGVMYAGGRTRQIWKELRQSEPGRGTTAGASPIFEPFSYIPDLDMLVQVFPYDRRLPALPLLMAGPPPDLEPLLLARFGAGEWRAEAWDVEVVRYRADQRAALRLTAQARDATRGQTEERRFYAKVYNTEEKGEQAFRVLQELWDRSDAGGEGFSVGKPIAHLSGLQALVQEEVPGTSLARILSIEREVIPAVRRAARAVAALHLTDVVAPRRLLLRDEIAKLERVSEPLRSALPHLEPRIKKVVGSVGAGLREEVSPAPTHGDLKPLHILLDGDSAALIDFDNFVETDPVLDVAKLLRTLTKVVTQSHLPQDRLPAVTHAFTEEYFARVPEDWRTRLPLHYASNVLKNAAQSFRRQQPGWPDKVEAHLQQAEDSLAGKIW